MSLFNGLQLVINTCFLVFMFLILCLCSRKPEADGGDRKAPRPAITEKRASSDQCGDLGLAGGEGNLPERGKETMIIWHDTLGGLLPLPPSVRDESGRVRRF